MPGDVGNLAVGYSPARARAARRILLNRHVHTVASTDVDVRVRLSEVTTMGMGARLNPVRPDWAERRVVLRSLQFGRLGQSLVISPVSMLSKASLGREGTPGSAGRSARTSPSKASRLP